MTAPIQVVVFSCALLGFRHGFDYDHIAAITDITGVQRRASDAMRLGLIYALGHAITVAALGTLVIGLQLTLPHSLDRWSERLVGVTLIVLAIYVLASLIFRKGAPKSRAALLIGAGRWIRSRSYKWFTGREIVARPVDVNGPTCFGIGVIHGLGAETPSQLALFLLAANIGGTGKGMLGLGIFLLGLLAMNTLITAAVAGVFTAGRSWSKWTPILTGLTAIYSLGIGMVFLLGYSDRLMPING